MAVLDSRFWSKVDKADGTGCWIFGGRRDRYGRFWSAGRLVGAHRLAYEDTNGPIPSGLDVLHTCDTPGCVRPIHLRPGTVADNMADAQAKGRRRFARGEGHPKAKLTWALVGEIRCRWAAGTGQRALGRMFGVHHSSVAGIVGGRTWQRP